MCFVNPWGFVARLFSLPIVNNERLHSDVSLNVVPLVDSQDEAVINRDQKHNRVNVEDRLSSKIKEHLGTARQMIGSSESDVYTVFIDLSDSLNLPVELLTRYVVSPELTIRFDRIKEETDKALKDKGLVMNLTTYGGNLHTKQPIIVIVMLQNATEEE